jgi:hypothetical protein
MTITVRLVEIKPKRSVVETKGLGDRLDRLLSLTFAKNVIDDMSDYPPQTPWKPRPNGQPSEPKSGLRQGGRRTGTYGRHWLITRKQRGTLIEVSNNVKYAVFVGGPGRGKKGARQARHMKARGWVSITPVSRKAWKKVERALPRVLAGRDIRG